MIRGAAAARRRPRPDAQVSNQKSSVRTPQSVELPRSIDQSNGCQPKQPAFANHTTDHRYARCETDRNIALAGKQRL